MSNSRYLNPVVYGGVSGLLAFSSFPKVGFGYIAWIAFLPLILFVSRAKSWRQSFLGGWVAGGIQSFALLVWMPTVLVKYGGLPVAAAWVLYTLLTAQLALYPAVACAVTRHCMNRRGNGFLWILPPAWISIEYAQMYVIFGGFPWTLLGYSQVDRLRLIQIADLTGVFGVSLLIISANTALAWFWERRSKTALLPLAFIGVLVSGSVLYGEQAIRRWSVTPDTNVALLQGNLSVDDPEPVLLAKFRDMYYGMAETLSRAGVDLLVFPESPTPLSFQYDTGYSERVRMLARQFPMGLIFNNVSYAESGERSEYYNSAYFIDAQGRESGRYDKIHLVPFGEYVPLKRLFFFAETISKDVGGFTAGNRFLTVDVNQNPVNAIICYEAAFPELVRHFVERGSRLIVNLTNDGWYGNSAAPYQHLAIARFRAIENRRFLLRAANTGISAVIEPTGRIQSSTTLFRREVCRGRFAFLSEQSLYARLGDVLAAACVIITCVLVVYCCLPVTRALRDL